MPTLRPVPLARTKLVAARQGMPFRDVGRPGAAAVNEDAVTLRPPPARAEPAFHEREPAFREEESTGVRPRPFVFTPGARSKQRAR